MHPFEYTYFSLSAANFANKVMFGVSFETCFLVPAEDALFLDFLDITLLLVVVEVLFTLDSS